MNQYTFNARYRQSVDRVLGSMGLYHVGTKKQVENGTLMYKDPRTDCLYALYESGYIRRLVPRKIRWGTSYRQEETNYAMYQLNPVYNEIRKCPDPFGTYIYTSKRRRLLSPIEQLGRITIAITNYRINLITQ